VKHTYGTHIDNDCQEKLKGVSPLLARWFTEVVKPAFPDCHIAHGWRGQLEQDKLFLEKLTDLKFPKSPHNKFGIDGKPMSLALDLFRQDEDGRGSWSKDYFDAIREHSESEGWPLRPIYTLKSGKQDNPHFELV
jgi:hypothetical protein